AVLHQRDGCVGCPGGVVPRGDRLQWVVDMRRQGCFSALSFGVCALIHSASGERLSPDSGDLGHARIWRSSSRSRPSGSIWASTPNSADASVSEPVSTVSPPSTSGTIVGKADRAVGPSRHFMRIKYN